MAPVEAPPSNKIIGFFYNPKPGDAERIEAMKEVNSIKFSTCRFSRIEDASTCPYACTFYDLKSPSSHRVSFCFPCAEYKFTPKRI